MRSADRLWNILTVVVLGMTALSFLCFGAIFVNPLGAFNFIAPPPVPALLAVPTSAPFSTATDVLVFPTLPPEWTATASPPPTASPTRRVTATEAEPGSTRAVAPGGTNTPFPTPVGPTITPTETEVPTLSATNTRPAPTRTATPRSYPAPGYP